jgi:hypothetical protein
VPVELPETTFNLKAVTGKPNETRAFEVAAERPELNQVASELRKVLEPL